MYSVMLVDDERPARELLKMLINWEAEGFYIVAETSEGIDAYEKYLTHRPDIIITDIQMPSMDGLSLLEKIHEDNPRQVMILLSCHKNFDYAQKAVKLGAVDYLIKDSLAKNDLLDSLSKAVKNIPKPQTANRGSYSPRIRKVYEYIAKNFTKDISLSSIADIFEIHKVHLSRTFKEETGKSIHEVLLEMRMEKAKSLLSDTDMRVSEIIETLGFNNPQSFYSLFKKYTGVSPSEYRSSGETSQE